jgi:hypothetical protein
MAGKVMIIEDEPALEEMLRYNFEAEGFSVVTCAHGEQTDLLIEEEVPDWSSWTGCCRGCRELSCADGSVPGQRRRPYPSFC